MKPLTGMRCVRCNGNIALMPDPRSDMPDERRCLMCGREVTEPEKPRIADLFCGAGGAAMGLHRAGFRVVGFDIKPQPNYPFEFHKADALSVDLSGFDAVWASPPCQGYSIMTNNLPWFEDILEDYPLLILPVRNKLNDTGLPYVIENVAGARHGSAVLKKRGLEEHGMEAGFLCGTMFGLPMYRHRYFESNWFWLQPGHPKHNLKHNLNLHPRSERYVYGGKVRGLPGGAAGMDVKPRHHNGNGAQRDGAGIGHAKGWQLAAQAMGIDWMKRDELTQAIPPAYSEFLGAQLMTFIERERAFSTIKQSIPASSAFGEPKR